MPDDQKRPSEGQAIESTAAYRDVVAALAESEERYRALVEGVRRYAIYMLDPQGIIRTWNSGIQELLGYSREETVGQSGSLCFSSEDRAAGAFEKELSDAKRSGESQQERTAVRKDGTHFAVNDLVTALHTQAGALIGFAKVTRELRPLQVHANARAEAAEEQLARALALLHVEVEHRGQLEAALLTAVEEERQRLGQDLHDDLCQHLGGAALLASKLAHQLQAKAPEESKSAETLAELIRTAIGIARNVARGLHPVTLVSDGLPSALRELSARVPLDVEFNWPESERLDLDPAVALHVYRIAEEAVANAIRHGGGTRIGIELTAPSHGKVILSITDDGKGFDPDMAVRGMGIRNMQFRAAAIGASLGIDSSPSKGTRVSCSVPLRDLSA